MEDSKKSADASVRSHFDAHSCDDHDLDFTDEKDWYGDPSYDGALFARCGTCDFFVAHYYNEVT